ncbi:MAG: DUF2156 domain-containing protein [Anaerovoracaceae bacterium]|jgi:hypothetical protein
MNIFAHQFEELSEKDIEILQEYFHGADYDGAGYTFLANYIWRQSYCMCWEVIEGYLLLAGMDCMTGDPQAIVAMPLTKDGTYDPPRLRKAVLEAKRRFDERKIPFSVCLIPESMVPVFQEALPEMELVHCRDLDEYVYEKEKLITLSGRALHKKKNHLNYFNRNNKYEVRPLTREMMPEIIQLTDLVREERSYTEEEHESLNAELIAISEMVKFLDEPDVYGVAIYIADRLEAFAIGERLSANTAVEHFEKANDNFRGLYQAICSEFCRSLPEEIEFVNREEDMGLENLRRAKEALKPHHMAKKYKAVTA